MGRLSLRATGFAATLAAAAVGDAAAQCVMCGLSAEAADPESASRTLAGAILVLLLPTLGLLAGALALLWKYRGGERATVRGHRPETTPTTRLRSANIAAGLRDRT